MADSSLDPSRYIIGIDLGTTNSAVTFVDTTQKPYKIELFQVRQWVDAQSVEARDTLPSFHYQPVEGEMPQGDRPWDPEGNQTHCVGIYAREQGSVVPGRFVSSAKSWLSQSRVDRTAAILPWHGSTEIRKSSPVEITARYLAHIRNCWNHQHPKQRMEDQDVMVTVPASFDEVARELTIEAAHQCGLTRLVLLEEPQAAFYAWIEQQPDEAALLQPGHMVLVVDVGGGTTDLSMIEVKEDGGFQRRAVGEHLILGGDNLDYALALLCESKLSAQLSSHQWNVLLRKARAAKERLLGDNPPEELTVSVPGVGSRLIGGSVNMSITREEVQGMFLNNYLPEVGLYDMVAEAEPAPADAGLVYASDNAVSRYIARFLRVHAAGEADAVLFNGGFFEAEIFRKQVIAQLTQWLGKPPIQLSNPRLDLAVAVGASKYGMTRRGEGESIEAGLARTYYIGVATPEGRRAMCIAPAGLSEGETVNIDKTFDLYIKQPVEFPIFVSSLRTIDAPGDLLEMNPQELTALPPIRTVLTAGKKAKVQQIKVQLKVGLTPIGTLDVNCVELEGERKWRLPFDVRSTVQTDLEVHTGEAEQAGLVDENLIAQVTTAVQAGFGPQASLDPERLLKHLEAELDMPRHEWPPSLLRPAFEELMRLDKARGKGPVVEARWLNILGFSLRPGKGYSADDWRVDRAWRFFRNHVQHPKNAMCCAEWWIFWRRIAAGLSAGRQADIAGPLVASLRSKSKGAKGKVQLHGHERVEAWRLLSSLEWLDASTKIWLGEYALKLIEKEGFRAEKGAAIWAIGRLGARVPAYAAANQVVPTEIAEEWLKRIMQLTASPQATANEAGEEGEGNASSTPVRVSDSTSFAVMQLARKTDDRFRDISDLLRSEVINWMMEHRAKDRYVLLVQKRGTLDREEQAELLGDQLPVGLSLF